MESLIVLQWWQVALAAGLIVINGLASLLLKLGMGKQIMVAALRTVVQLFLVGFVLSWVFALESVYAVGAIFVLMVLIATQAAIKRTGFRFPGIYRRGFSVMLFSTAAVTLFATAVVVGVRPWYEPQYLIPLAGMILGNTMNGVSVGLDRFMKTMDAEYAQVEAYLSLGATSWEAARRVVAGAVTTGMIPIINSMAVVGLVSLPGMMTGQILAGVSPVLAVRYQIMIMFLIAAGTALGTAGVVLVAYRRLFDSSHRLLRERLIPVRD